MKKLLIPLLLCFATIATASAEWTPIFSTNKADYYIDRTTISVDGGYREVWEMADWKTAQKYKGKQKFLSQKVKIQIDCPGRKSRVLAMDLYAGHMGTGALIGSTTIDNSEWVPIHPKSFGDETKFAVCGRYITS